MNEPVPLSRNSLFVMARVSFRAFLPVVFSILHPGQRLADSWYWRSIAWHLEQVAAGSVRRQIITLPPRHLKSIIANVAFPAWMLGQNPAARIVSVSYSNELSGTHARNFRRVVQSLEYQRIFPQLQVARGHDREMDIGTTQGGYRRSTSVGGTLTGIGGDLIIIDDPINADDSFSERAREQVNEWYDRSLSTRLDDPNSGAIVLLMQRLHEDDLVGHVTSIPDHGWNILTIPAIAPTDQTYRIGARPNDVHSRRGGDVIDARHVSPATLTHQREIMGERAFNAQYQQQPTATGGDIIKRAWLTHYDNPPASHQTYAIIQSWDTAFSEDDHNDYSVCTTWALTPHSLDLIDLFREKMAFPKLLDRAQQLALDHKAHRIVIEKAGSGISMAQTLRSKLNCTIVSFAPKGDKESRLYAVSHMIEKGTVRLPRQAPWLDDYLRELLSFPNARHDDQVDSTTQFLNYIRSKPVGSIRYAEDGSKILKRTSFPRSSRARTSTGERLTGQYEYGTLPRRSEGFEEDDAA